MAQQVNKYGNLFFLDSLSEKDRNWFLKHLKFSQNQEKFKNDENGYQYTLLEKMKKEDYCEDKINVQERIKNVIETTKKLKESIKDNEQIALVGHSVWFMNLLQAEKKMKNCEIISIDDKLNIWV